MTWAAMTSRQRVSVYVLLASLLACLLPGLTSIAETACQDATSKDLPDMDSEIQRQVNLPEHPCKAMFGSSIESRSKQRRLCDVH